MLIPKIWAQINISISVAQFLFIDIFLMYSSVEIYMFFLISTFGWKSVISLILFKQYEAIAFLIKLW